MFEAHADAKQCPLLAAAAIAGRDGGGTAASTGSSWGARCKGKECAWWDAAHQSCIVAAAAQEVGQMFSSTFLQKTA